MNDMTLVYFAIGGFVFGVLFDSFVMIPVLLFDFITYKLFPRSLDKLYWIKAKDFQIFARDVRLWNILHEKDFKRMRVAAKMLKRDRGAIAKFVTKLWSRS